MGEKGIYTLVDAHQDVFARRICGEGVPDFYAEDKDLKHNCVGLVPAVLKKVGLCVPMAEYGHRIDENGDPYIEDC